MSRVIDMKQYLPPFMVRYDEMNQILTTEEAQFQDVEDTHNMMVDNRFIVSCDETGIARFEDMLGISPLANDTLEGRRFRVLTYWNKVLPYNYAYLDNQLESLCGRGKYRINLNTAALTLIVKIALSVQNMFTDCEKLIRSIVPCNVVTEVQLMYNTHEDLALHTHGELASYTHQQLRTEEF